MKKQIAIAGIMLAVGSRLAMGQEWKQADGPLKTRWAQEVSPRNALPDYPRMQMVRKDWMSLNGVWDLALPDGATSKILVPFPVESALSGVMKHAERMTYRRLFEVPAGWAGKQVLLHFGAVDWEAKVSVNGKELGTHRGGYDGFSFDITDALKPSGAQEVVVEVFDPTNHGDQPCGKQSLRPNTWFYTPSSGIWQAVWLEPVPKGHIESLRIVPDVDGGCVNVTVAGEGEAEVTVWDGGRKIGRGKGPAGMPIKVRIRRAKLWSPDSPHLYDLAVKCGSDEVTSYFGMRKIEVRKDGHGINRILLNGKPVFQVAPLDQGFWPDGLYTAPTDEALRYDIEITKRLGFNCTRKHVKVEPDRWYYWCDKLGLLVWQDMPSGNNRTADGKKQFEQELRQLIEGLRNHPAIILWVVFNEGWGQYDTERLTAWVKTLDPTRLVNNASGWHDAKCGDLSDMHKYPGPGCPNPEATRAAVLGEFGGLGLGVDGHTWTRTHWGYQGTANEDALTRNYSKLLSKTWALKDDPGLCACIYTQLTDVETECNGLLTYDRAVIKVNADIAVQANKGMLPPPPKLKALVPTSEKEGQKWRYTLERPGEGWFKTDFNDAAWKEGVGGFGAKGTAGACVRTEWKTADIWLRSEIELREAKIRQVQFRIHHDEDVEIYLNGILAGKAGGYTTDYEDMALTPEGVAALKPGKNRIAVHCRQTNGGQYIDVGLVEVAKP